MGGNENFTLSHFQSEEENQPVSGATSAYPGTSADSTHSTIIAHQLRSAVSLTSRISATQKTITIKAAMNWQNTSTLMGMGAEGMGITNGNGNKTRLNLWSGMGMGMNHWEWEGMELKKTFPLICSVYTAVVFAHAWHLDAFVVHDVGSFFSWRNGWPCRGWVVQCLLDYHLWFSAGVQGKRTDWDERSQYVVTAQHGSSLLHC